MTAARLKWVVAVAGGETLLAAPPPGAATADGPRPWGASVAPAPRDGIVIRLLRDGCGQVCSVSGNLWFDDFSLRAL
jgi:hypothetical protein